MREVLLLTAAMGVLTGLANAASSNDEVLANAALRELHNVVLASAQSERAAKDNDAVGCRDAYESMQKAAHEALMDIHSMSFAPINALDDVSSLLQVSLMSADGCPDEALMNMNLLLTVAGEAIISLRNDYAIGDAEWYRVNAHGDVEAKNPLRYAQSLKDQNYIWTSVRPKEMYSKVETAWKAEMASQAVDDTSIEDSGSNLKAVEVDYREKSDQDNTTVYFYRTKQDALAAAQVAKQKGDK